MKSLCLTVGLACALLLALAPGAWAATSTSTKGNTKVVLETDAAGNLVKATVTTAIYDDNGELVSYQLVEYVPPAGTVINAAAVAALKASFEANAAYQPTNLETARTEIGTVVTDGSGKKTVQVITTLKGQAPVTTTKQLSDVTGIIPPAPPTVPTTGGGAGSVTVVVVPQSGDGDD